MIRNEESSIVKSLFNGTIKLMVLLVFVFLINYLSPQIADETFSQVVHFINQNLAFLVIMNLVLWIADMLFCMSAPLSLISPWVSAVGSVLVVKFIFKIIALIGIVLNEPIFESMMWIRYLVYPIASIGTIVGGYIKLMMKPAKKMAHDQRKAYQKYNETLRDHQEKEKKAEFTDGEKIIDLKPDKDSKSWGKIRKDFIQLMEDVVVSIRNGLGLNKKK